MEEKCLVHKLAHESAQTSYDEVTGLPLDPKMVSDAFKEELMFMRFQQVYREGPACYLEKFGLKSIGARWVFTNKCDAANPFIRAPLVAQETNSVSEITPEGASGTFAATLTTGESENYAQSMHDWLPALK